MNYVTLLKKDTGLDSTHEIETVMLCRDTWSGVARCSRASTGFRFFSDQRLILISEKVLKNLVFRNMGQTE